MFPGEGVGYGLLEVVVLEGVYGEVIEDEGGVVTGIKKFVVKSEGPVFCFFGALDGFDLVGGECVERYVWVFGFG